MRHPDWLPRLRSEIDAANARPFAWGEHDCCKFAARCVDAMTGTTHEASLSYHDKPSALRFLATEGGLEAALTRRFGEPVTWARVQRGDLCLVQTEDGIGAVGVCVGAQVACVAESGGIHYVPTKSIAAGWKIP